VIPNSFSLPLDCCCGKKVGCTACGDRTRDQSIKSRTLYLTELRRPEAAAGSAVQGLVVRQESQRCLGEGREVKALIPVTLQLVGVHGVPEWRNRQRARLLTGRL
jgi:hypothetical protein